LFSWSALLLRGEDASMQVITREDREFGEGYVYTKKVMKNGEKRSRLKLPDGTSVSKTIAKKWSAATKNMPWQDAHFHGGRAKQGGLVEVYTQLSGWSVYVWKDRFTLYYQLSDQPGEEITFEPRVQHVVLLGPQAIIKTHRSGTPVGNPSRKGNDWWPATASFKQNAKGIIQDIEYTLRDQWL
jgi:hypothetical protein